MGAVPISLAVLRKELYTEKNQFISKNVTMFQPSRLGTFLKSILTSISLHVQNIVNIVLFSRPHAHTQQLSVIS